MHTLVVFLINNLLVSKISNLMKEASNINSSTVPAYQRGLKRDSRSLCASSFVVNFSFEFLIKTPNVLALKKVSFNFDLFYCIISSVLK